MNTFREHASEFVSQVALNGYFIADRKEAAAIAREVFPAAAVRWVYYPEVETLAMALQALPDVTSDEQEMLLARSEARLPMLQPPH